MTLAATSEIPALGRQMQDIRYWGSNTLSLSHLKKKKPQSRTGLDMKLSGRAGLWLKASGLIPSHHQNSKQIRNKMVPNAQFLFVTVILSPSFRNLTWEHSGFPPPSFSKAGSHVRGCSASEFGVTFPVLNIRLLQNRYLRAALICLCVALCLRWPSPRTA